MPIQYPASITLAILRLPVRGSVLGLPGEAAKASRQGPSSAEGKWLALKLAWFTGLDGEQLLVPGAALYKRVGIPKSRGAAAFAELQLCGWIRKGRFDPSLRKIRRWRSHDHAISLVLRYDGMFEQQLRAAARQGMDRKNALLLATLLAFADEAGRVRDLSDLDLSRLTGFNSDHQLKCQMQRLQELGFVSKVVPGMTGSALFGVVKSCIYLNLLHPCLSTAFLEWRGFAVSHSQWRLNIQGRMETLLKMMQPLARREISQRRSVTAFFEHFVYGMVSEMLSMPPAVAGENVALLNRAQAQLRSSSITSENLRWFMRDIWIIAQTLRDTAYLRGTGGSVSIEAREEEVWKFCLLPVSLGAGLGSPADDKPYALLLTNCPYILGDYDSSWLGARGVMEWVSAGLACDPALAPRKYRSGLHGTPGAKADHGE